jgi:hypothetical protein
MREPHSQSFGGRAGKLLELVEDITGVIPKLGRERVRSLAQREGRLRLRAVLGRE